MILAHNASDLLHGAIVAGSVLAVSSAHAEGTTHVAVATGLVTAIYWLAHVYVDAIVAGSATTTVPCTYGSSMLHGAMEVLVGALPPILIFLPARLLGADVQAAAQPRL